MIFIALYNLTCVTNKILAIQTQKSTNLFEAIELNLIDAGYPILEFDCELPINSQSVRLGVM